MWFVCEKEGIAGAASVWTVLISTCVVLNVGAVQNVPPIINLPQAIFGHTHTRFFQIGVHTSADYNVAQIPHDCHQRLYHLVCANTLARLVGMRHKRAHKQTVHR